MRLPVLVVLSLLVQAASASSGLEYPSVWVCDEDRFQWYCDLPSETTPPDPPL